MATRMMRVLVISPEPGLEEFLRRELSPADFEVLGARPGTAVLQTARGKRPEIAVVHRIDTRHEVAALELAILRDIRPDVRIILVSGVPSSEDALLLETGVFYYLAASPPLRLPELVRAAAASILRETSAKVRQGELR